MKKILSILLCMIFCLSVPVSSVGQTNKGKATAKKTAQKSKTQKKTGTSKKKTSGTGKSQTKTNASQDSEETYVIPSDYKPLFEGELLYRSEETHSKIVRMLSFGNAYNGERTVLVKVGLSGICISDLSTHLHTIIIPDAGLAYIYSDVLNEGRQLTIDQIKQLYGSALDLTYSIDPNDPMFVKSGAFQISETPFEYKGDVLKKVNGVVRTGDANESDIELWFNDKYDVPESYCWFLCGYDSPGIAKRFILNHMTSLPFVGQQRSVIATELVGVNEAYIEVEDLLPPADAVIKPIKDVGKLTGFYKANDKALKKNKLKPKTSKSKDVKRSIQSKWEFADDWYEREVNSPTMSQLEKDFTACLTNLFQGFPNIDDRIESESFESKASGKEVPREDSFYIPDLLAKYQSLIEDYSRQLQANQQVMTQNVRNKANAHYKYTRVGPGLIRVPLTHGMRPTLSGTYVYGLQAAIGNLNKLMDWVKGYGLRNRTDYIPKSKVKKYNKSIHDAEENARQDRREARQERSKFNMMKIYNRYAEMLSSSYYSPEWNHRTEEEVRDIQDKMRSLRLKYGYTESEWETWGGIPGVK